MFCVQSTDVRIDIVLSLPSGKTVQSWRSIPPYVNLAELGIKGARKSYKILKGSSVVEDNERVWQGERTVELTMVICREAKIVLQLYVCLGIGDEFTALRLCDCVIPVTSQKMPARQCLESLYNRLLWSDDEAKRHLVALLREDIKSNQVLRRDLLRFATSKDECHLGHVKIVAVLDEDDNRFALRMKTEEFLLIDDPAPWLWQATRHKILDLSVGVV